MKTQPQNQLLGNQFPEIQNDYLIEDSQENKEENKGFKTEIIPLVNEIPKGIRVSQIKW